jgi:hypothetical protein
MTSQELFWLDEIDALLAVYKTRSSAVWSVLSQGAQVQVEAANE